MAEPRQRHSVAVLAGRLLLLVVTTAATVGAFVAVHRAAGPSGRDQYACPMHPEVSSSGPGRCPICGMALVVREPVDATSGMRPELRELLRYDVVPAQMRTLPTEVRAPAWVEPGGVVAAVVYRDEVGVLIDGEPGTFVSGVTPETPIAVRLSDRSGVPVPDRAMARVSFRVAAGVAQGPSPGDVGWVLLPPRPEPVVVVPVNAVLWSSEGAYLLVAAGNGRRFQRRPVEIGKQMVGLSTVVSGLAPGERVAGESAFLADAELRLRGSSDP